MCASVFERKYLACRGVLCGDGSLIHAVPEGVVFVRSSFGGSLIDG